MEQSPTSPWTKIGTRQKSHVEKNSFSSLGGTGWAVGEQGFGRRVGGRVPKSPWIRRER